VLSSHHQQSLAAVHKRSLRGTLVPDIQLVPSFQQIHAEPLRPTSILLGAMFSITVVGSFALANGFQSPARSISSPIDTVLQRLNQPTIPPPQEGNPQKAAGELSGSGSTQPATAPTHSPGSVQRTNSAGTSPGTPLQAIPLPTSLPPRPRDRTLPGNSPTPTISAGNSSVIPAPSALATLALPRPVMPGQTISAASLAQVHKEQAQPLDATQAMIQAISAHPIVMFGETHGNKQEYAWLCRLVKTPEFANRVDDIVVEFGNSLYQKSVDRYIAGEDVPLAQVQKAWRNVIGAVGPVSPVYGDFYQAVRESNLERRGGHQIRLLLGDPYGDWAKIRTREDLGPYLGHRNQWYAQVVRDEVLSKHHRALLIIGAGHFLRRNGPGIIEQTIQAAGIQPYLIVFGTNAVDGYDDLDRRFDSWHLPAIVALRGNWVGQLPANPVLTGGCVAPNSQTMADVADAMLYVGSRDSLTLSSVPESELVGTDYGKEVERRLQIQTGRTMDFLEAAEGPQYQKPLQQIISNGIHLLPPDPPKSVNDPLPPRPPSQ